MKRITSVLLAVVMCVTILPFASAARETVYPTEKEIGSVMSKIGVTTTWMGGSYFRAGESGEDPVPDRTVWSYMNISGLFEDYYHEWDGSFEGYRMQYDTYMELVDSVFANHSDMKDYLIAESTGEYPSLTYDEATGEMSWYPGGLGGPAEWALLNYDCVGDYVYAYGYFIELIEDGNIEGLRENYDYVVKTDEYGESYWKIQEAMKLVLKLEEGLWKILSYEKNNWYIIDGVLYNRAYNVTGDGSYMVNAFNRISSLDSPGMIGYTTNLLLGDFAGETWYNLYGEETALITPTLKEGWETFAMMVFTPNGKYVVFPDEMGDYRFVPEGEILLSFINRLSDGAGEFIDSTDTVSNFGEGRIDDIEENILENVLSESEIEAINNGSNAKVYLEVSDISSDIDEATVAQFEEAGAGGAVLYLDIDLFKQVADNEPVNVTETASEMMISINIPEELKAPEGGKYKVYRLHDGKVEFVISGYSDVSGGVLFFYTDRFSTYAITYGTSCEEHTWGEWEVIQEPGENSSGVRRHICTVCGDFEYEDFSDGDAVYENPFTDILPGKWYTDGVLYCYSKGYMAGTSETTFGYRETMNRQMFATILAKIDGADTDVYEGQSSFTDVKAGEWYSNSIEWAYRNGYASGIGEGAYGRKNPVTREQLALFLYTYSEKNGIDVTDEADLSGYEDIERVHDWALDAVEWAVSVRLISGTSQTTLSPRNSATRAEVALIIKNYTENVKA